MDSKRKVVLIDDEEDICGLIKKALVGTGQYDVLIVHDGLQGQELCLKEKPDLVLLDIVMPGIPGGNVIEFLRTHEETKDIPILVISGLGEMTYLGKTKEWKWFPNVPVVRDRAELPDIFHKTKSAMLISENLGVADFLAKPFRQEVLIEVIEEVLSKSFEERYPKEESDDLI